MSVFTPRQPLLLSIDAHNLRLNCACVVLRHGGYFFIFTSRFADLIYFSVTTEVTSYQMSSHFGYMFAVHPRLRSEVFVTTWTLQEPLQYFDFVTRPRQNGVSAEARMRLRRAYDALDEVPIVPERSVIGPLHNVVSC